MSAACRTQYAAVTSTCDLSTPQIKDEAFVEDINNLLNAGEVPNMFASDEKMAVMEQVGCCSVTLVLLEVLVLLHSAPDN